MEIIGLGGAGNRIVEIRALITGGNRDRYETRAGAFGNGERALFVRAHALKAVGDNDPHGRTAVFHDHAAQKTAR